MCGILGIFNAEQPIQKEIFSKALNRLHHRGPDEKSIYCSDDNRFFLGHTRLSVVGLHNGKQPLLSKNEDIIAVVNGEFYGYRDIKKSLSQKGYSFSTETDSEILIALYQKYGIKCLEHLEGEFTFALYDHTKKAIFLARDRFGTKPLYYAFDKNQLLFASEIKALRPFSSSIKFDSETLSAFYHLAPFCEKSCFENILQIPPASYLIYESQKTSPIKYWRPYFNNQVNSQTSEKKLIQRFKSTLEAAVERRMIADTPIGCYLSGGIDSTSILALASKINPAIEAFTIAFEHEDFDESPFAQRVADSLKVNLSTIQV